MDQVYFQYDVKDFSRAKKFYADVLGLEKTWDGGEEAGWVEFALPVTGARVGLNLKREGEISQGSGTLTLVVKDLDVTRSYFQKQGIKATEIKDVPDMVSYFNIEDTEGNLIQVVSDPRITSGEK